MEWNLEQDILACKYYLSNKNHWARDIDTLVEEFKKNGYDRSRSSIQMRVGNYASLDKGGNLGHFAKQSEKVYKILAGKTDRIAKRDIDKFINETKKYVIESKKNEDYNNSITNNSITNNFVYKPAQFDQTFQDVLISIINRRDWSNTKVYTKSYIDRKAFSKLLKDGHEPKKETVWKLCIGLECDTLEASLLMKSAHLQFANQSLTEQLIFYCISNKIYDTDEIDATLYDNNEPMLFSPNF